MFLDKKLQVDFSTTGELPELAICGCEWAFLRGSDHIREHLRGCTFCISTASEAIYCKSIRSSLRRKNFALHGFKGPGRIAGPGFAAAQHLYLLFYTTKGDALPFLAGLGFGSAHT
jgi:hypothetical protein